MKKTLALLLFSLLIVIGSAVLSFADSTPGPHPIITHPIVAPGAQSIQNRATLYAITRTGLPQNLSNNTLGRWRKSIEQRGLETPSSLTPGIIAEAQRFRAAMLANTTPTLSPH